MNLINETSSDEEGLKQSISHLSDSTEPFSLNSKEQIIGAFKTVEFILSFRSMEINYFHSVLLGTAVLVNKKNLVGNLQPIPDILVELFAETPMPK